MITTNTFKSFYLCTIFYRCVFVSYSCSLHMQKCIINVVDKNLPILFYAMVFVVDTSCTIIFNSNNFQIIFRQSKYKFNNLHNHRLKGIIISWRLSVCMLKIQNTINFFLMYDPTYQRNIMNLLKMCDIFEVKYISLHSRYVAMTIQRVYKIQNFWSFSVCIILHVLKKMFWIWNIKDGLIWKNFPF